MSTRKWLARLGPVVAAAVLTAAFWILHRELRAYHYADLSREIRELPTSWVVLSTR